MDFGIFLVLLNFCSFLVCLLFFILQIKVKSNYLTNLRPVAMVLIIVISVLLFYTLVINYIFGVELTSTTLLLTYYVLIFCLLDIFLLLWHKNIISNYRPAIKTKRPNLWRNLYQSGTYAYIGLRSLYFLSLLILSVYIAPIVGMLFLGQYTLDNLINLKRYDKALGFCRYATFVLDNQLYVESLESESVVSVSKVYCLGLFKKRAFLLENNQVYTKKSPEKNVVLLRKFNSDSSPTILKIEDFNKFYKLYYFDYREDTIEYIIAK